MSDPVLLLVSADDTNGMPPSLNRLAVAGFALAVVVAVVGLFALPTLRAAGLSFRAAFAIIGVAELAAAFVTALAVYHLYD